MSPVFAEYPQSVLERFKSFHKANLWVFQKFCEKAFVLKKQGKKSYGARCIIESIRYDHDEKTKGDDVFEINNDFVPIFARLAMYHYPQLQGFFETRQVKSKGIKSQEQQWREVA